MTLEGPLSCMPSVMIFKLAVRLEILFTNITNKPKNCILDKRTKKFFFKCLGNYEIIGIKQNEMKLDKK